MTSQAPLRAIPIKVENETPLDPAERAVVTEACTRLQELPGALLPILHAIQDKVGFVPKGAVPLVANALNVSRAEVHGVLTFYHYFRTQRPGKHVFHLCRAEACQSVGAAELEAHAKKTLGVDFHGTTSDGAITLEPVYCLGNCALGPSLMIDDRLQGRVSAKRFDALVAKVREDK